MEKYIIFPMITIGQMLLHNFKKRKLSNDVIDFKTKLSFQESIIVPFLIGFVYSISLLKNYSREEFLVLGIFTVLSHSVIFLVKRQYSQITLIVIFIETVFLLASIGYYLN